MRIRVAIVVLTLLASAAVVARADRFEIIPSRSTFAGFPMTLGAWRGQEQAPFTPEVLAVLRVDDYLTRIYTQAPDSAVGLYIGYWQSQRQGDTIHSPLNCLPGSGWEPVSKRPLAVRAGSGSNAQEVSVNRYLIQKGMDRALVLYWYQAHGRVVASEYWGKLFLVTDAVRLNRTDGAIVRVLTNVARDDSDAEAKAERTGVRFMEDLLPVLPTYLPN